MESLKFLAARLSQRNPLPTGTLAVGVGLLVNGAAAYGFIAIATRVLGAVAFAPLAILWPLIYFIAPGFFLPLEQEVGRAISARRAKGLGGAPVVKRAATAAGVMLLVILLACLAALPVLSKLFSGHSIVLAALVVSLILYAPAYVARGTLSGNGRFNAYAVLVGAEGVIRVLAALVLVVIGIKTVGYYAVLVGGGVFLAMVIALWGQRGLLKPGPEAPWSELTSSLSFLLVGSVLSQFLINATAIAVPLLTPPSEQAVASRVLTSLIMARIPLFLFQAVQAALLPKLAHLAAAGKFAEFKSGITKICIFVCAVIVISIPGGYLLGPFAVSILAGHAFELARIDFAFLAGGSAILMLAIALGQALVALEAQWKAALGWAVGTAVFLVVVFFYQADVLPRVEWSYLAAALAASGSMALQLFPTLHSAHKRHEEISIAESLTALPAEP